MQTLVPVADVGSVNPWRTTGFSYWSQINKTNGDTSTAAYSPLANINQDYVQVQLTPGAQPNTTASHSVVILASKYYPAFQQIQVDIIDGNTSAVKSTFILTLTQTPTTYTQPLPTADVGGFNATTYQAIQIKVTRLATVDQQVVYLNEAYLTCPGGDLSLAAEADGSSTATATLSFDVSLTATVAGAGTASATMTVDGIVFLTAEADGSSSASATLGFDFSLGTATAAGGSSSAVLLPTLLPQSRRDRIGTGGALPAPASRRDR